MELYDRKLNNEPTMVEKWETLLPVSKIQQPCATAIVLLEDIAEKLKSTRIAEDRSLKCFGSGVLDN